MGNTAAPTLSLVIASVNGGESLMECIASFVQQPRGDEIEIVVAESSAGGTAVRTGAEFANVRWIHFTDRRSIPELRAAGFQHARGSILAMTEDHCQANIDWVQNTLSAHESPALAIGGVVENAATDRLIDWAVFFCEYGRYMNPIVAGPTLDLPGPNVSYKREALDYFRDLLAPATWESLWHARLVHCGIQLINDPRLVVYHRKNFTLHSFLIERYHYSRSFAGRRVEGLSRYLRVMYACAAPLLPPLLLWRIVASVLRKGRHRRELLCALPYIVLFTLSWSLGELIGYTRGAGDSTAKIA